MRRAVLAAAAAVALAGCGAPAVTPHVSVDTPALRAAKAAAGIADCPAGFGTGLDTPGDAGHSTNSTSGPRLPAVTLPCLGGGTAVALAKLRGPMLINLWAQDCGPCRAEMPLLQAFSQKYAGRVVVLGVDYADTQPALAIAFARQAGVTYPLAADLTPSIQTSALPTTILIDAQGKIVFQRPTVFDTEASIEQAVSAGLGVQP